MSISERLRTLWQRIGWDGAVYALLIAALIVSLFIFGDDLLTVSIHVEVNQ